MPIEITMPRLSDTMEAGTIIKWNVAEGDSVSSGDVVADVETDKATMELTSFDEGTIAKILVPEGQSVDVGTVIAVLAEKGEDASSDSPSSAAKAAKKKAVESRDAGDAASTTVKAPPRGSEPVSESKPAASPPQRENGSDRLRISPVARRLADEMGVDVRSLQGSGPSGRIIKRDVLGAADAQAETTASAAPPVEKKTPAAAPAPAQRSELATIAPLGASLEPRRVPLSNIRITIAKRLVESKATIPHYQVSMVFDMDALLDLRETLNQQLESLGVKLSVNDFLVRGCALAMHEHPEFNASWGGDHLEIHGEVNIGMAISLPRERGGGLVVGVIRHADQKSQRAISQESKYLAPKARERGHSIEEMSDSTFTLSSDHRIIDGAMAAQYLQTLKGYIENPATLMV